MRRRGWKNQTLSQTSPALHALPTIDPFTTPPLFNISELTTTTAMRMRMSTKWTSWTQIGAESPRFDVQIVFVLRTLVYKLNGKITIASQKGGIEFTFL